LSLINDYSGIGIILKKKGEWDEILQVLPEAEVIYKKIHEHPFCYCVGEDERDPAKVIAISDLVISACFTSTTVEALGARKKAIYFDATNWFKGFH